MKDVVLYTVVARVPERLSPLEKMAGNLWFCWNPEAIDLFRSIDQSLWEESGHNPLAMLGGLPRERLNELLEDEGFLLEMDQIYSEFRRYTEDRRPYGFGLKTPVDFRVAYISAEFGLTDCLPIYSGGLGILAGDHLKSASDLRVPLVGVGLLYQKGYFRQYLNPDGWQQEMYPDNDVHRLPVALEKGPDGAPVTIDLPIGGHRIMVRVWRIQVGRVPLFMLDTNTALNSEEDRDITSSLYGGDKAMRLKQEIVLGIGGIRVLDKLGIHPDVLHMNEGHCTFAILERIRLLMEKRGLSLEEARHAVLCSSVFTTHTPVPAGIDIFDGPLLGFLLGDYLHSFGVSAEEVMALGAWGPENNGGLNMAILGIRNSARTNGVSQLHRGVSRRMWRGIWPDVPEADIPIESVTNGVHIPSWISNDMAGLLDRYLGRRWAEDPDNVNIWERVNRIPDLELWRTHERRRERLVAFARVRLERMLTAWGAKKIEIESAREALHPEALTIGFSRRFATYKRGDLILRDPARLSAILNDPKRPVQIIFAGKAHPQDHPGKEMIRNIIHLLRQPEFSQKLVFLEDYDLNVGRYLVQGADVWLNNPLRPLEACGTSGMKAAANGALNMSVLDGWWAEGYEPGVGWAIGAGEEYQDAEVQDRVESQAIYNLLEKAVVPLFYDRGRDNLPREWIGMMKHSMRKLASRFNAHRMVEDYLHQFYLPSAGLWKKIDEGGFNGARDLAAWARRLRHQWDRVRVLEKTADTANGIEAGACLEVKAWIATGSLSPGDLKVDLYYGRVDSKADFQDRSTAQLKDCARNGEAVLFRGEIPCRDAGRFGFRIRILPSHPLLLNPYSLGLIAWG
jgi:glycogen phosphorylase